MKRRNLNELDDVLDEIIARNAEWADQLEELIKEKVNERHLGRKVSS